MWYLGKNKQRRAVSEVVATLPTNRAARAYGRDAGRWRKEDSGNRVLAALTSGAGA
jgi:hypothetical protein